MFGKKNSKKVDLSSVNPTETKPERTVQQIQEEYQQLAFRAGNNQYQIYTLERDLDVLNSKMRELNFEAAAAQQAEAAKKAAEAAQVAKKESQKESQNA